MFSILILLHCSNGNEEIDMFNRHNLQYYNYYNPPTYQNYATSYNHNLHQTLLNEVSRLQEEIEERQRCQVAKEMLEASLMKPMPPIRIRVELKDGRKLRAGDISVDGRRVRVPIRNVKNEEKEDFYDDVVDDDIRDIKRASFDEAVLKGRYSFANI